MDTPGVSLFQGVDGLKVNSTLEREQEEEALEDQRRRNEELGNLLLNAFDDLADDDTTMDSMNYQEDDMDEYNNKPINGENMLPEVQGQQQALPQHPITGNMLNHAGEQHFPRHDGKNDVFAEMETFQGEIHGLKMLLESRTNELETIKQLANDESRKNDDLQKRLLITEAELNRALTAKSNTHELLVESKEKCSNLESTINKLRDEKKNLETENNTLLGKLETTATLLADVQQKYNMVERDLNKHNERNAEMKLKQLEDRHRTEMEILHQQREQIANKLEKKCNEYDQLSSRYQSLQQTHESMQIDKATKINDLNHALCEAQSKVDELLSKPDYHQETLRLQKLVANFESQIQSLEESNSKLRDRWDQTTAELEIMNNVFHQHNLEDTPKPLSQAPGGLLVGSTPLDPLDRMMSLKDDLCQALSNLKSKREEIRTLQAQLQEKKEEINMLHEIENKGLIEISTLKEENQRLKSRLKLLEDEIDSEKHCKELTSSEILEVNRELEQLRSNEKELMKEKSDLESELNSLKDECQKLESQMKNSQVDLEEMKEEYENMKRNYEDLKNENQKMKKQQSADHLQVELARNTFLLKDAQAECDRLKKLYVEVVNEKEKLTFEMEKLKKTDTHKELSELREKAANLQRALQLAEVKSSELSKILENDKLTYEREVQALREKYEKERIESDLKTSKDNSNNCIKCIDLMAEQTKFEISNLKLNNINAAQKAKIDELQQVLEANEELIADLQKQLNLREQQEELIKELKLKAKQFEDFIHIKDSSSDSGRKTATKSLSQQIDSIQQESVSVQTSPDLSEDKTPPTSPELQKEVQRKIEARLREEIAADLETELKRYQLSLKEMEEKNLTLKSDYKFLNDELQQRQHELEILKTAMLAEREKVQELLEEKDAHCQEIVEKHVVMLHRCRDELKLKNKRISELSNELEERQAQIKAERESMKLVMTQWEAQRKNIDEVEHEWKEKLKDLKNHHREAIDSLTAKYNSAKRTAANYKRYSEDKEAHMLKEYDRLKFEYEASLAKIEKKMRDAIEKKNRELKDAPLTKNNKNMTDKNKNEPPIQVIAADSNNKDNLEGENKNIDEENKENQKNN